MENEINIQLIFWIGTAFMVIAIISILLILAFYHKHQSEQKQKEAETLLRVSIESETRERQRIASDLHDSISGDLMSIANYITVLEHYIHENEGQLIVKEISQSIINTLKEVQKISFNLMPPQLDVTGFIPALTDYLHKIEKWHKVTIETSFNCEEITCSHKHKYELFRIIQELMNNLLKHGQPTHIQFTIEAKTNNTNIIIKDNGLPFNFYKSYKESTGFGLKNIISRIHHIDAELKQTIINNGNSLTIQLKN